MDAGREHNGTRLRVIRYLTSDVAAPFPTRLHAPTTVGQVRLSYIYTIGSSEDATDQVASHAKTDASHCGQMLLSTLPRASEGPGEGSTCATATHVGLLDVCRQPLTDLRAETGQPGHLRSGARVLLGWLLIRTRWGPGCNRGTLTSRSSLSLLISRRSASTRVAMARSVSTPSHWRSAHPRRVPHT